VGNFTGEFDEARRRIGGPFLRPLFFPISSDLRSRGGRLPRGYIGREGREAVPWLDCCWGGCGWFISRRGAAPISDPVPFGLAGLVGRSGGPAVVSVGGGTRWPVSGALELISSALLKFPRRERE